MKVAVPLLNRAASMVCLIHTIGWLAWRTGLTAILMSFANEGGQSHRPTHTARKMTNRARAAQRLGTHGMVH